MKSKHKNIYAEYNEKLKDEDERFVKVYFFLLKELPLEEASLLSYLMNKAAIANDSYYKDCVQIDKRNFIENDLPSLFTYQPSGQTSTGKLDRLLKKLEEKDLIQTDIQHQEFINTPSIEEPFKKAGKHTIIRLNLYKIEQIRRENNGIH